MNNDINQNYMGIDVTLIQQLKASRRALLFLGFGLIIIGALAIIFSTVSTIVSMVYVGCLLLVIGIFKAIKSFQMNSWGRYFIANAVVSFLWIIAGLFIIINPLLNAITFTLIMAIFFIISGIMRIFVALSQRIPHQSLVLASGILNVVLGILIWSQWPSSGLWVIGMFIGIDAMFAGWTCISLAAVAKRLV